MDVYCGVLIAILAICFSYILISALRSKSYSFKMIKVGNDRNIEAHLRILMRKNPDSEIVVIDNSKNPETGGILRKMQYDFPEIHIIRY